MKQDKKEVWIKVGYEAFALKGLAGLQVERIAKVVGKSKSSFYHHFVDIDCFVEDLLSLYLNQSKLLSLKESQATAFNPDIINVFIEHKWDILFSKQLILNQQNPLFSKVLETSSKDLASIYTSLLKSDLKINIKQKGIESFFHLAFDNFFLQINEDNLNFKWLSNYFDGIKTLAKSFE